MTTIYLSSTYSDLKAHREAVYDTLRKMRYDVIAMEDYVATDQRPLKKCLADVVECDLYVGLLAWRYGFIPTEKNPEHKSITELEYLTALQNGKPCLIFLVEKDAPWPPTFMDAVTGEGNRGEYITTLRHELAQERVVSFFSTPEHLASLVGPAVHDWEKSRNIPAPTGSPIPPNKNLSEATEREARLYALLADHISFMQDRLESFVGRQVELVEIKELIQEKLLTGGYVTITGQAGQGKSSIIAKLIKEYGGENTSFHFIPVNPGPDHQVSLLRNLMSRLILKYGLSDLYVASESRAALKEFFPKVLKELAAQGGQEVIFIDGLDQLEEDFIGIRDLSFLPTNPPAGIVFVLGTRPNDTLKPLELLKPHEEYFLPGLSRQDFDLMLRHRQVSLEQELADKFYEAMQENALYLDLVAKELREKGTISPREMIARISYNPENIFSLSMTRLKRRPTEWREVLKPILGVLLVAREPLEGRLIRHIIGIDNDQLTEGLVRLGGLITNNERRQYSLFHSRLYDYLRQDESKPNKEYIFAIDEVEGWNKKLADWCEKANLSIIWQDTKSDSTEQKRREYARQYYIVHLYYAAEWKRLFAVLDSERYGRAKVEYDPSTHAYALDLQLGRRAAASEVWNLEEGMSFLPHLWRYTLLQCSLTSRADLYNSEAFEALLLLKHEHEAIGLAELLTDPNRKVSELLRIARLVGEQHGREEEYLQLLIRSYEFVRTIKESETRTERLLELGAEFTRAHRGDQAEVIWNEIEALILIIHDSETKVRLLLKLGAQIAKASKWQRAEMIWKQIESIAGAIEEVAKRAKNLLALSAELAEAQQWEQAEKVWLQIKMLAHKSKNNQAKARLLLDLGTVLAEAQQREQAEKVWLQIKMLAHKSKNSQVKTRLLLDLGTELAKAQRWEQAETVWSEAARAASMIKEAETKELLEFEMVDLAEKLAKVKQWEQAEAIANNLKDKRRKLEIFLKLGEEFAKAQQWDQANVIWSKVQEPEHFSSTSYEQNGDATDNGLSHIFIYDKYLTIEDSVTRTRSNALLELCINMVKALQWEPIEAFWVEIEKLIVAPTFKHYDYKLLLKLGEEFAKSQQWDRANVIWNAVQEAANIIEDNNDRANVLLKLCKELAKAQQWDRAEAVWSEVPFLTHHFEDSIARSLSILEISNVLIEIHRFEQAEILAHSIEVEEIKIEALLRLASELTKEHQWDHAEAVASSIEDDWFRKVGLSELSIELAKEQQWNHVEVVASSIEDDWTDAKVLPIFVMELAKAQQWDLAEELTYTIMETEARSLSALVLVTELSRAQQWDRAEVVAHNIRPIKVSANLMLLLGVELAKMQKLEQAEAMWSEVIKIVGIIKEKEARARILVKLGTELARVQNWDRAEAVWCRAEEVACTIEENEIKAEVLLELSAELAKAQRWKQAEKVWTIVEENALKDDDTKALLELSVELVKAHRWDRVERVTHLIKGYEARAIASLVLGSRLILAKQSDRAKVMWTEGMEIARAIKGPNARAEVLMILGAELAKAQQWDQAQSLWTEVEEVASTIEEGEIKAEVLIGLGAELAKAQQWDRVQSVWTELEMVAETIKDSWARAEVLLVLSTQLIRVQRWEQAEAIVLKIEDNCARSLGLLHLGKELARMRRLEEAEKVWIEAEESANTIQYSEDRMQMLREIAGVLTAFRKHERLLGLVQRSWLQADTREHAIYLLQLATGLVPLKPEIGMAFYKSFEGVDNIFLALKNQ